MPELPDFPRPWHFARAIVEGARATGEDPLAIAQGDPASRGRCYAFWALHKLFPRAPGTFVIRGVGGADLPSSHARVYSAAHKKWWRPGHVDAIQTVVAVEPPWSASGEPSHSEEAA